MKINVGNFADNLKNGEELFMIKKVIDSNNLIFSRCHKVEPGDNVNIHNILFFHYEIRRKKKNGSYLIQRKTQREFVRAHPLKAEFLREFKDDIFYEPRLRNNTEVLEILNGSEDAIFYLIGYDVYGYFFRGKEFYKVHTPGTHFEEITLGRGCKLAVSKCYEAEAADNP